MSGKGDDKGAFGEIMADDRVERNGGVVVGSLICLCIFYNGCCRNRDVMYTIFTICYRKSLDTFEVKKKCLEGFDSDDIDIGDEGGLR